MSQCCHSVYQHSWEASCPIQMLQYRFKTKLQRFAVPPGAFYSLQQRLSALSPAGAAIHVQNNSVHHVIMSHIPTEWINSRGCCSLSGRNLICMSLRCIDYTEYMSAPLGKVPAWESAMLAPENRRNLFVSATSTSKPRSGSAGVFVVLLLWYEMKWCGHEGDRCSLLPVRGSRPT